MKIDDVSLTIFAWNDIPTEARRPPVAWGESDLGLLTIRTDQGIEGHSFLGASNNPASMDAAKLMRWLKPLLMGQDPLMRESLYQAMHGVVRLASYRAIGAVDVALWDLAGKIADLPVHALLGTYRTSVPAYASSQRLPDVGAYVDQAQQMRSDGFPAYKIHPLTQPDLDIQVCREVRSAVGSDYTLMLDSTWSYNYTDALRVGQAIEEMGYYWYEDPLADQDIYNYGKLRQKLRIPIMATEYPAGGVNSYPAWLIGRATDYLRGDVPNKGGITTMIKTAHLAEAFGLRYEMHHSGNSLNNLANLHVAMAIKNCEFFEVLQPDDAHKYGLAQDLEIDSEGLLHAPTGPGLGAKIDFDLISHKTLSVLS